MKSNKQQVPFSHQLLSIFFILALAWLTVSLPFIHHANQLIADADMGYNRASWNSEEVNDLPENPLNNTTEEKTGSNNNVLSEFLQDPTNIHIAIASVKNVKENRSSDLYLHFYGDIHLPPPKF